MSSPLRSTAVTFARYCLDVQYAGRHFGGWTSGLVAGGGNIPDPSSSGRDVGNCTVPGVIETIDKALETFVGREYFANLRGSSRTDAGVSAICNRFHVDIARPVKVRKPKGAEGLEFSFIETEALRTSDIVYAPCREVQYSSEPPFDPHVVVKAVNKYLDREQLHVMDARVVDSTFDAVRNALSRTYMYRIVYSPGLRNSSRSWLLQADQAWNVHSELDIKAMQQAAASLVGTHDFSSFRNAGCVAKTPVRNLISFDIVEYDAKNVIKQMSPNSVSTSIASLDPFLLGPSRLLIISVRANAFLYRMVRNMVSVLVKVGRGQMTVADVQTLMQAKDRAKAPPPAPASGLFLAHVEYAEEAEWNKVKQK
jgi:tRNA pseudouridine38-40 synthase